MTKYKELEEEIQNGVGVCTHMSDGKVYIREDAKFFCVGCGEFYSYNS
jgi:hypothetical protein